MSYDQASWSGTDVGHKKSKVKFTQLTSVSMPVYAYGISAHYQYSLDGAVT